MISYFDLTKLFVKSLQINKMNRKGGRLFFYTLLLICILFIFIPFLLIFVVFLYEMFLKLNDVSYAAYGLEALLGLLSIFLFIFSFNVLLNELYFSEDIDSILPLPVRPETLFASKFSSCFFVENILLFIILLFSILAYANALHLPISSVLLSVVGIIFLPLIPMVYGGVLLLIVIYLFKSIANRQILKKMEYILVGLLVFGIAFLFMKLSSFNFEAYFKDFANGNHQFLDVMRYVFPSISFFVKGVTDGSVVYMGLSILTSIFYFILMILIARYLYYDGVVSIASKDTDSLRSSYKKITNFRQHKPITQYFMKDIKMLFRSPTFFINCIVINIIWPVFVFLIFKIGLPKYTITHMRELIGSSDSLFYMRLSLFVLGVSILVTAFNSIASSAFSREGKNYYFIKYIPMKYGLQWREKFFLSFVISFIGIEVYSIPFFVLIHLPIGYILFYLLLSILSICFVSFVGIMIDSIYPKLVWDDEADSLRENYNAFVAMGFSLLLFGVLCVGGYYLYDHEMIQVPQFLCISFALLIILNIILYFISSKRVSYSIVSQENV